MPTHEQIEAAARAIAKAWGENWECCCTAHRGLDCACGDAMTDERSDSYDERLSREDCRMAAKAALTAAEQVRAPSGGVKAHPDDLAVDRFASAMKTKLAQKRAEGRGGWEDKNQCSAAFLSRLLVDHVEKGDPLDVGNIAMMLHQRGERIADERDRYAETRRHRSVAMTMAQPQIRPGKGGSASRAKTAERARMPAPVQPEASAVGEAKPVGVAAKFGDMTRAVFDRKRVPVGTKLYTAAPVQPGDGWTREYMAVGLAMLDGVTLREVKATVGDPQDANNWREYLGRADDLMAHLSAAPTKGDA